jgi:signal transduction histidine kinase
VLHARGTRVSVEFHRGPGQLVLRVGDDGRGFDPATVPSDRLGIVEMRRRTELLEGLLEIRSAPGAGTVVVARLPWG